MKKGKFIVIDGPDGAGKSYQLGRLKGMFDHREIPAVFTREPGGSPFAESLRDVILSDAAGSEDALCMLYLFNAARASHVMQTILPALQRGVHVVSDRFDAVTFAYQIVAERRPDLVLLFDAIRAQYEAALNPFYICLDVPPEVGRARLAERGQTEKLNHFDSRPLAWHRLAREGFEEFLRRFVEPHKRMLIDADRPRDEVLADVASTAFRFLRQ